jgi:hypothetical protein
VCDEYIEKPNLPQFAFLLKVTKPIEVALIKLSSVVSHPDLAMYKIYFFYISFLPTVTLVVNFFAGLELTW